MPQNYSNSLEVVKTELSTLAKPGGINIDQLNMVRNNLELKEKELEHALNKEVLTLAKQLVEKFKPLLEKYSQPVEQKISTCQI